LIFSISLKLNYNIKQNLVLIFTSTITTLYVLEIFLAISFPELRSNQLKNIDNKNKLIKYQNFIKKKIYPFDVINKKFNHDNLKIYPLSYISNIDTFLCNETGKDIFYKSDKNGFRNKNTHWYQKNIELLLIGDSFVHGACEDNNNTIANFLRKKNSSVINLGLGGAGPLKEFAIFVEYAPIIKPKNVIWFYSEGTDLTKDLRGEKKNMNLINYLESGYSQNLINNQIKLKPKQVSFIENRLSEKINLKKIKKNEFIGINKKITYLLEQARILRLWNIRTLVSSFTKIDIKKVDPLFFELIENVNLRLKDWGGKLYFVYMPEARRYENHLNRFILKGKFRSKDFIINKIKSMNIEVIDVDSDIFSKEQNPLSYFNKMNVHYNATGYKLIATEIFNKVQN